MSVNDFFTEKKEWSKVKDAVLGCYLKPYFNKVLSQGSVTYVDSFAGKGKFDDGNLGSPLIAYNVGFESIEAKKKQGIYHRQIKYIFIDNQYADELEANTSGMSDIKIVDGTYQDNISEILKEVKTRNIFVYIDPFGIKYLNQDFFLKMFEKRVEDYSIETLVNFNSFGFIREACRLLQSTKVSELHSLTEKLEERNDKESYGSFEVHNDINNMNNIAGGEYWQNIVKRYSNNEINMNEAEVLLAEKYTITLRNYFKHTISFPIKSKEHNSVPRYRLVFCTNYYQGYLLMVDNMQRRHKESIENIEVHPSLFEFDISSGNKILEFNYEDIFLEFVTGVYIDLYKIIIKALDKYSISLDVKKFISAGKSLESSGIINVLRNPAYTKRGKRRTYFAWNKSIKIKKK